MGRKLASLGAVAIKNSVYALPRSEETREDLEWVRRDIVEGGGDASICEAAFVEGITDAAVEALFIAARDADYAALAAETRALKVPRGRAFDEKRRSEIDAAVLRLKKRLAEVAEIDFFGAGGRQDAEARIKEIEARLQEGETMKKAKPAGAERPSPPEGATWVTRKGIKVDRIASAWLIRRFIDPTAKLKFVEAKGYRPLPGEIRFDMFEAEYTHVGDRCTFEVLAGTFIPDDPALRPIGEIVHDIDIKDGKFGRPDTAGVSTLIAGIAAGVPEDEERLVRGTALFDGLYTAFSSRNGNK